MKCFYFIFFNSILSIILICYVFNVMLCLVNSSAYLFGTYNMAQGDNDLRSVDMHKAFIDVCIALLKFIINVLISLILQILLKFMIIIVLTF